MSDPIAVVPYDPEWPKRFAELGRRLRDALGDAALRIDHIGSTAVPGLDAKPIVDIQISVASFEPLDAYLLPLERAGYVFRADNEDLTKRYFRESPGDGGLTFTFAAPAAGRSRRVSSSATPCGRTPTTRRSTPSSSGSWQTRTARIASSTPTPRRRSSGTS